MYKVLIGVEIIELSTFIDCMVDPPNSELSFVCIQVLAANVPVIEDVSSLSEVIKTSETFEDRKLVGFLALTENC